METASNTPSTPHVVFEELGNSVARSPGSHISLNLPLAVLLLSLSQLLAGQPVATPTEIPSVVRDRQPKGSAATPVSDQDRPAVNDPQATIDSPPTAKASPAFASAKDLGPCLPVPSPLDFVCLREFARGDHNVTAQYWLHSPAPAVHTGLTPRYFFADLDNSIQIHFDRGLLAEKEFNGLDGGTFARSRLSLAAFVGTRGIELPPYSQLGQDAVPVGPSGVSPLRFLLNLQYFQYSLHEMVVQHGLRQLVGATGPPSAIVLDDVTVLAGVLKNLTSDSNTALAFYKIAGASPIAVDARVQALDALLTSLNKTPAAAPVDETKTKAIADAQAELDKAQALSELKSRAASIARDLYQMALKAQALETDETKRAVLQALSTTRQSEATVAFDAYRDSQALVDDKSRALAKLKPLPPPSNNPTVNLYRLLVTLDDELNYDLAQATRTDPAKTISRDKIAGYWESRADNHFKSRRAEAVLEIFSKLIDAKLILSHTGAKPGDIITIELRLYSPDDVATGAAGAAAGATSSTGLPTKYTPYPLAEIHVGNFGWHTSVADSFLLIKRFHDGDANDPNNVSNNFRPSPGVSLLWSERPRPEETSCFPSCWVARNIAPSFGLNASFVSFDKTKQFEVGLSAILGLFDDQVQIGSGVNLSGNGSFSQRTYWFLGLSFARIAEKLGSSQTTTAATSKGSSQ